MDSCHSMEISHSKWQMWMHQWLEDIKLAIFLVALLAGFRLLLLALFRNCSEQAIDPYGLLLAFTQGVRFDLRAACYLIFPLWVAAPLFALTQPTHRFLMAFRRLWGRLWIILTILTCTLNTLFFAEFHKQFNLRIYGIIFDDRAAIFSTAWQTYPLIKILLGAGLLIAICLKLYSSWKKPLWPSLVYSERSASFPAKMLLILAFVSLFVTGIRGTLWGQLLKEREVQVTNNTFLTEITLNPYIALWFTHQSYQVALSAGGMKRFLPSENIMEALKTFNPNAPTKSNLISDWLQVEVPQGPLFGKIKHVFIIIMESQEAWPLLPRYHKLNLCPNLLELTKKGRWVKAVASSTGTMHAIIALTAGLPEVGVYPNHNRSSLTPYPTAVAPIAEKLGFETHFFYGGSATWENIGNFAKNQGFDYVNTGVELNKPGNHWGVDDEYLFDYILDTLPRDQPTFNVIMTTSNHPPHSVDVYGKGFPLKEIPPEYHYDGSTSMTKMGHYWYCDKALGDFIRKAEKQFPDSLFVITADHTSGHFLTASPPLVERFLIPLIFYTPNASLPKIPASSVGSHNDILPTVINLIAPNHFSYATFGRDILNPNISHFGIHCETFFITHQGIYHKASLVHPFMENAPKTNPHDHEIANAIRAIAWYIVMKGNTIDKNP